MTIRQPLQQMGSVAASLLLKKLAKEKIAEVVKLDPELVVRESTAAAKDVVRSARRKTARKKTEGA